MKHVPVEYHEEFIKEIMQIMSLNMKERRKDKTEMRGKYDQQRRQIEELFSRAQPLDCEELFRKLTLKVAEDGKKMTRRAFQKSNFKQSY